MTERREAVRDTVLVHPDFTFAPFESEVVLKEGTKFKVTDTETNLLLLFMLFPNRTISEREISNQRRRSEESITRGAIKTAVSRLNSKFYQQGFFRPIVNIAGRGYRLFDETKETADVLDGVIYHSKFNLVRNLNKAMVDDSEVELTYFETELLAHMMTKVNTPDSREDIRIDVFGWDGFNGSNMVDVMVKNIKAKLACLPIDSTGLIVPVRKVGYMVVDKPKNTIYL